MRISRSEWESFGHSLGGTAFTKNTNTWFDLENFFVKGLSLVSEDPRLMASYVALFKFLICILSPRKIQNIASSVIKTSKESKILAFVIDHSLSMERNKTKWTNLLQKIIPLAKINKKEQLFSFNSFKHDKVLLKFGLLSDNLELDKDTKYINLKRFKLHPLIKSRFMGVSQIVSDILFLNEYYKKLSLSQMSKLIHYDKASLSEAQSKIHFITN